jgi:lysophospholipase L1-like esterase
MSARKLPKLLLVGDSMIEFFDWQARFPDHDIKNLGRSGESVRELRERVSRIVDHYEAPDLVLVMIGTNDVARENFNFLPDYADILDGFQEAYPGTTLVVNSLLPMELNYLAPDTVPRVNSALKSLAASCGAGYLDAWAAMVDKTGQVVEGLLEDEVHLSLQGYAIWSAEVEHFLSCI